MTYYKYTQIGTEQILLKDDDQLFDAILAPGTLTPHSGIYRCEGCGKEDVSTRGHHLPPQNHHQHHVGNGHIRWRLIIATKT